MPKQAVNSKCGCGSGKKFKKCCILVKSPATRECEKCGFKMTSSRCETCESATQYKMFVEKGFYSEEAVREMITNKFGKHQMKINELIQKECRKDGVMTGNIKKCLFCTRVIHAHHKFYVDTERDEYICSNCYLSNI